MTALALCEFPHYTYTRLIITYETEHGFYWFNETFDKDQFYEMFEIDVDNLVKACNFCFKFEHCSATEYYSKNNCIKIEINTCYNEFITFNHTFSLIPYINNNDNYNNDSIFICSDELLNLANKYSYKLNKYVTCDDYYNVIKLHCDNNGYLIDDYIKLIFPKLLNITSINLHYKIARLLYQYL